MLDIHTHILPGIDDGARSAEETERMLAEAQKAGITQMVATPHLFHLPEHADKIRQAYAQTAQQARVYGIELWQGYEVLFDAVQALADVSPFCIRWSRPEQVMLLEFRTPELPERAEGKIAQWVQKGVRPVIVHPERYLFVQEQPAITRAWRSYGCMIQVDASGLSAPFYTKERRTANALLKMGVVDWIASDAHRPEHFRQFGKIMRKHPIKNAL